VQAILEGSCCPSPNPIGVEAFLVGSLSLPSEVRFPSGKGPFFLSLRPRKLILNGVAHKLGDRTQTEVLHNISTVLFNGPYADS
jgi:hypothetical protein